MAGKLMLASASQSRRMLMENAGLQFEAEAAQLDERAAEAALGGNPLSPDHLALELARLKAIDVASRHSGALVIGCDQTMSLDEVVFHKPVDIEEARRNLKTLRGRTHRLNSAVVLVRDGEVLWENVSIAELTMREFSDEFLEGYLQSTGDAVLKSVGCYQLEAEGIRLFNEISGDYFTILGLPLLPLLEELRVLGEIDG